MNDADLESDDERVVIRPGPLVLRTTSWNRFLAAGKLFVIFAVAFWLGTLFLTQLPVLPGLRWKQRNRIAIAVALPISLALAARRYAIQYYQISVSEEALVMRSSLREIRVDPLEVQGIIGTDGLNFSVSESIVWKYVVILSRGKRYVLSFDPPSNAICYDQLREECAHAWGVPYEGHLEIPVAGAELDSEDYIDALRQVHGYYRLHTIKSIFSGLLMMGGGGVAIYALAMNQGNGARRSRLYLWFGVIAFVGLMVMIRAWRQVFVLSSIKSVEKRLRATL